MKGVGKMGTSEIKETMKNGLYEKWHEDGRVIGHLSTETGNPYQRTSC